MDNEDGLSFINRILDFFQLLFRRKERTDEAIPYSKFRQIVDSMDDTADYLVADLSEEALRIVRQRLSLIEKIQNMTEKMTEIECFDRLNDEDAAQLKNLLESFISLTKERNVLRYQLTDFDKSITHMESLETDADFAMPNILDAEKRSRMLRHDLSHLKGEKTELEYEQETLQNALAFINKFTYAVVGIFCFITIYLGYTYMFQGTTIFFAITILVLLAMVVIILLHFFRRRMRYELLMNLKKQQKAVDLLNKKGAVFAHYTNFLNYEYKKYKVRSASMLKTNLSEYNNYKHVANRIDSIRKIMYETQEQIEQFLRDKKINHIKSDIEQFVQTVNVDDKKQYYQELSREKAALEKNLSNLDARHEAIWDSLVTLNERDTTEEKIVEHVIQVYIDEVNKLVLPKNHIDKT